MVLLFLGIIIPKINLDVLRLNKLLTNFPKNVNIVIEKRGGIKNEKSKRCRI